MGIRETGYRHWDGEYTGHGMRWWSITKQGIRATVFNKVRLAMLLIFIFVVWAPFIASGIGSYFAGPREFGFDCTFSETEFGRTPITTDEAMRCNLYDLLRGWQFLVVPVYVAMVAAPLVSSDLRSNAFYIYLSKPLRRVDYIFGKMAAVGLWTVPVTLLPNLFLWLMVVLSSNEASKLGSPTAIFFQILVVQMVFLAVLCFLALAIASFTRQWQTAFMGFLGGYFGLWFVVGLIEEATRARGYHFLSVVNNVVNFAQGVYGVRATPPGWTPSFLILIALIGAALLLFIWRILKIEVAE